MRRHLRLLVVICVILTCPGVAYTAQHDPIPTVVPPCMQLLRLTENLTHAPAVIIWRSDESLERVSRICMYDTVGNLQRMVTFEALPDLLSVGGVSSSVAEELIWSVSRQDNGLPSQVTITTPDGGLIGSVRLQRDTNQRITEEVWLDACEQVRGSSFYLFDPQGRLLFRASNVVGQPYSIYEEYAYESDVSMSEEESATAFFLEDSPAPMTTIRYHVSSNGLITSAEVIDELHSHTSTATQTYKYDYSMDSVGNWNLRACRPEDNDGDADGTYSYPVSTDKRTIVYYSDQEVLATSQPSSIFSGRIADPAGIAIKDVLVIANPDESQYTSGVDGKWSSGVFTIAPAKEGWTFSPTSQETTRPSSALDFVGTYSVSGRITDESGKGLPDVTVSFAEDHPSVTTGEDGKWAITGAYGRVIASPNKKSWRFTPAQMVLEGPSTDADFQAEFMQFKGSGRIVSPACVGVGGIRLAPTPGYMPAMSTLSGYWEQDGLEGEVTVTPYSDWFTFTPSSAVVTKNSPSATFTAKYRVFCEYFNYSWLFGSPSVSGTPVYTQWDEKFSHYWGYGSPSPQVNCDGFAARFTAQVPLDEGTYEFIVVSDDGVRVYIGSSLVIDAWYRQDDEKHVARTYVPQGIHTIRILYFERRGGAGIEVRWEKK